MPSTKTVMTPEGFLAAARARAEEEAARKRADEEVQLAAALQASQRKAEEQAAARARAEQEEQAQLAAALEASKAAESTVQASPSFTAPASDHPNPMNPTPTPTPWQELQDAASGKVYYYNSETRETTWNRPV